MKFKTKPIYIEAIQYNGDNGLEIRLWSGGLVYGSPVLEPTENNPTGRYLQIPFTGTTSSIDTVIVGDWIVKNQHGFFISCEPDIFEKTYEKVEE